MQINLLLKKGWAVGIILLFVAIVFVPAYSAQVSTPQINFKAGHADSFQGVDMVIIWGTLKRKSTNFRSFRWKYVTGILGITIPLLSSVFKSQVLSLMCI